MKQILYFLMLCIPVFFFSCGNDDSSTDDQSGINATYRVYSSIPDKLDLMVSYNDDQGQYIVKVVESGWTLDVDLPKGTKAFLSATIRAKEGANVDKFESQFATVQILQKGKIIKEAQGLTAVVEILL